MFYAYHARLAASAERLANTLLGGICILTGMASRKAAAWRGLMIFAAAALQGCSPASVVRPASMPAAHAPAASGLAEPAANEAVIVINNNAAPGTHAGIFAGTRLNDPAGSYVGTRSQDKNWPGPSLADYVEFQKEDGDNIQIYRFKLSPADFAALDARMASSGPTPPLFCAVEVQNLIAGLGPFRPIPSTGWATPASLGKLLEKLIHSQVAAGKCVLPNNQSC